MGLIFLALIILLIFPEVYLLIFAFIGIAGYGILEFILRLFGKSFNDEPTDEQIKEAYIKYADSHWNPPVKNDGTLSSQLWSVKPMQHNYESFAEECKRNPDFYRKYKK